MKHFLLLLCAVLWAQPAWADAARVQARARLEPAGAVMPGQPVKLIVTALTTTWFTGAPVFPPLDVAGAIVSPPGEDASNLNQEIGGVRWFGVERSYVLTPQTGGEVLIPPITLLLQVGQISGPVKASTAPITLQVKVVQRPPGAENAIGTRRLEVRQTLDRPLAGLKQGDALTRTIQISADGVQGMLLPPTVFAPQAGLAVYAKPGKVTDINKERVGFLGSQRVDAATYVIQQAGDYTLPALNVPWWDTRANVLRTASIPALHFSAAAVPAYRPEIALPLDASAPAPARIKHVDVRNVLETCAALMVAGLALAWGAPRIWRRACGLGAAWQRRRLAWQHSEAAAWRRLQRALRAHRSGAVLTALYAWLAASAQAQGEPRADGLTAQALDVSGVFAALYGPAQGKVDFARLRRSLRLLRKQRLARALPAAAALPQLNPSSGPA